METIYDYLIIGGGLSGLFTGALLSKAGKRVLILEKNGNPGGGLQMFSRKGISFSTGMHYFGGGEHGPVRRVMRYLGIDDRELLMSFDKEKTSVVLLKGERYDFPTGREPFTNYLISRFPNEEAGIRELLNTMYHISDAVPLLTLSSGVPDFPEEAYWTTAQLISSHIHDPELKNLLGYQNLAAGIIGEKTPAYIYSIINVQHIEGIQTFVDGTGKLVDALMKIIVSSGGEVKSGERVDGIASFDGTVTMVSTAKGQYSASNYISAISLKRLDELTSGKAFSKVFRKSLLQSEESFSAFCAFSHLRPQSVPLFKETVHVADDFWNLPDTKSEDWPEAMTIVTPPSRGEEKWARTLIAICPVSQEESQRICKENEFGRSQEYIRWKEECLDKVTSHLERIIPDFKIYVQDRYSSSPLTIRDYYGTSDGSMYGLAKDVNNYLSMHMSPKSRLKNLIFTGQDVFMHGICGVLMTSVQTAEICTSLPFRKIISGETEK